MPTLRVAVTQFQLQPEPSLDDYLHHVTALVEQAASGGAELILFPEFASTGLLATITDHHVTSKTIASDYRSVLSSMTEGLVLGLQEIARRHSIVVAGGSHSRLANDGSLRNTAYLAFPDGRLALQDKLHLTPQEHSIGARGGDSLGVARVGPFTVGTLVCADIQFPELSRYLVAKGADMILCPSLTWNRRGVHRVRTGCAARAMENQLYVVMSPLVGHSGLPEDAPLHAIGQALVTGPVDKTVGRDDGLMGITEFQDREDMLIVDLDQELLLASRAGPEPPGIRLQRPDLYERLRDEVHNQ